MPYIHDCISTSHTAKGGKQTVRVWLMALMAVFAFLLLSSAMAADGKKARTKSSAQTSSTSQDERSTCMNANVDRASCMREMGAARQESKRGKLTDAEGEYQKNALMRCNVFTDQKERQACERRVTGDAKTSGSVQDGGIIRQTTTVEVVQPGTTSGSQPSPMQPGRSTQ